MRGEVLEVQEVVACYLLASRLRRGVGGGWWNLYTSHGNTEWCQQSYQHECPQSMGETLIFSVCK